jgi:hypothetical protein
MESARKGKLMVLPLFMDMFTCKEEDILVDQLGVIRREVLE